MRSEVKKRLASFKKKADDEEAYEFIGETIEKIIFTTGVTDPEKLFALVTKELTKEREERDKLIKRLNTKAKERGLNEWSDLLEILDEESVSTKDDFRNLYHLWWKYVVFEDFDDLKEEIRLMITKEVDKLFKHQGHYSQKDYKERAEFWKNEKLHGHGGAYFRSF